MASIFRFEFLFEPNTLDTVGTQTPRWQSYVGTREGSTAEDAAGWVDCTSATWFTIVDGVDITETWTTTGLYVHDTGLNHSDSVRLNPTAAFLALGTPTALKVRIVTELPESNIFGLTNGRVYAADDTDYIFSDLSFSFAQMHGVWRLADLRSTFELSYIYCSAYESPPY